MSVRSDADKGATDNRGTRCGNNRLVRRYGQLGLGLMAAAIACAVGCESYLNQTASLGGPAAGQRGSTRVLFINNTPYQAVFTYGSYDQYDQDSSSDFEQFGLQQFPAKLHGNSTSSIAVENERAFIECARVFAVGSERLQEFIQRQVSSADLVDEANIEGVEFFKMPIQDDESPDDDADAPKSVGFAPPFEALLGVDFPCGSLLIVRFEHDGPEPDPFRIDFELIPSKSDR